LIFHVEPEVQDRGLGVLVTEHVLDRLDWHTGEPRHPAVWAVQRAVRELHHPEAGGIDLHPLIHGRSIVWVKPTVQHVDKKGVQNLERELGFDLFLRLRSLSNISPELKVRISPFSIKKSIRHWETIKL